MLHIISITQKYIT